MAGKSIDILISTIFKATGIDAAKRAISQMGKSVGRNLANIKAGFDLAASGVKTFLSALSRGMSFERMTLQFKQLTGSLEDAKRHMADLQDLGRTPPFDLESFASASREMMKMSGGILGFKKDLEIVGDMAAATGNDVTAVGRAFGMAYQIIRDGQSFGRAGQQLFQLGILTKKQVENFNALSMSGANNAEVWAKLSEEFARYKGAMAETEKTTKGIVDAIQGEANVAITEFSSALAESASPALEGLLGWMRRINEDGSIEEWASSCVDWFSKVKDGASAVLGPLGTVVSVIGKSFKSLYESAGQGIGGFVGALQGGGGISDAFREGLGGIKEGFLSPWDIDGSRAEYKQSRRADAAKRKSDKRAKDKAEIESAATRKLYDNLASAQKKREDEKRAAYFDEYSKSGSTDTFERWLEDKAKEDAKALKDAKTEYAKYLKDAGLDEVEVDDVDEADEAFSKWRANRDKRLSVEAADAKKAADERLAAELAAEETAHEQRIANIRSELQDRLKASQEAAKSRQSSISNAQSEFDKAFGMYRDKDLAVSTIKEERDYAADYKRLQKDASRYGGKWRIDELASLISAGDTQGQAAKLEEWRKSKSFTPEVEAMVRASAADQTRTTAEAELRKISSNTENLAKKLDELLMIKG